MVVATYYGTSLALVDGDDLLIDWTLYGKGCFLKFIQCCQLALPSLSLVAMGWMGSSKSTEERLALIVV